VALIMARLARCCLPVVRCAGGRVFGDWLGLGQGHLYDGRDLLPMRDVRAYADWAMHDLIRIERSALEQAFFPGLEVGVNPRFVLWRSVPGLYVAQDRLGRNDIVQRLGLGGDNGQHCACQ